MLKQRILTAIILIPLFLLLLFKLSPQNFCIFTGAVVLWAAWEWSGLMGVKKMGYSLIYPCLIAVMLVGSMWLWIPSMVALTGAWWLFAAILVVLYPKASQTWGKSVIVRGLMGCFVLIPCWLALNFIRNAENGTYTLLFLFIIIWGADIGAYFAGKWWGKHKLAPAVSPGKTWQGVMGALGLTLLVTLGTLSWMRTPISSWLEVVTLIWVTVIFSIVGDLFESMLKRNANLKDSGRFLPGHGGILDRIDSLTAAAPIFVLGILWLQKVSH